MLAPLGMQEIGTGDAVDRDGGNEEDEDDDEDNDLEVNRGPAVVLRGRALLPPMDQQLALEEEEMEIDHLYQQQERATQRASEQSLLEPSQLRNRRRPYPVEFRHRAVRDMPGPGPYRPGYAPFPSPESRRRQLATTFDDTCIPLTKRN